MSLSNPSPAVPADLAAALTAIEAPQQQLADGTAVMAAAWRRLLALRDGLAGEVARRQGTTRLLPTAVEQLLAAREARQAAQWEAAGAAAAAAIKHLEQHRQASFMARLRPRWREANELLAREAAELTARVTHLQPTPPQPGDAAYQAALQQAAYNRAANARALAPVRPYQARLDAVDLAIQAVRAGDEAARACLQRWDIPLLEQVARLWQRQSTGDVLSDVEAILYRDAVSPSPPAAQPALGLEAALLALAARISQQHPAAGRVLDGEWEEVPQPGRIPPPRLQAPPVHGG